MLRSMMQIYVRGSDKAAMLYQEAFDAKLVCAYPRDDGTFIHAELDVYGQILAISEAAPGSAIIGNKRSPFAAAFHADAGIDPGNTMQFCLHFGRGGSEKVRKAYDALKDGCLLLYPIGPVEYSPCMVDLVDRFGVRWCLFEQM